MKTDLFEKNGGYEKKGVIVDFSKIYKKHLIDFSLLKLSQGESILCVQRVHPVPFLIETITRLVIEIFLIASFIVILNIISVSLSFSNIFLLNTLIAITSIILVLLIESYAFLSWYYQLYIITSRAFIHRKFFHIAGPHSEAVFLDQVHQQEIDRSPPNILYDYLRIENVTVKFHKLERDEPFIFKTPESAQEIEDAIQELTIHENKTTI